MADNEIIDRSSITEPPATVTAVETVSESGSMFTGTDGWSLGVGDGPTPRVGDVVEVWGKGPGYPVRGLAIGGHVHHYRTDGQFIAENALAGHRHSIKMIEEFLEHLPERDAAVAALPDLLRRRIERFQNNKPSFRWEHETYEVYVCQQAAVIAEWAGTTERIDEFRALPYDEQIAAGLDDGHSGNTFGAACQLAYWLLNHPEVIAEQSHAAISVLVGCVDAGCHKKGDFE